MKSRSKSKRQNEKQANEPATSEVSVDNSAKDLKSFSPDQKTNSGFRKVLHAIFSFSKYLSSIDHLSNYSKNINDTIFLIQDLQSSINQPGFIENFWLNWDQFYQALNFYTDDEMILQCLDLYSEQISKIENSMKIAEQKLETNDQRLTNSFDAFYSDLDSLHELINEIKQTHDFMPLVSKFNDVSEKSIRCFTPFFEKVNTNRFKYCVSRMQNLRDNLNEYVVWLQNYDDIMYHFQKVEQRAYSAFPRDTEIENQSEQDDNNQPRNERNSQSQTKSRSRHHKKRVNHENENQDDDENNTSRPQDEEPPQRKKSRSSRPLKQMRNEENETQDNVVSNEEVEMIPQNNEDENKKTTPPRSKKHHNKSSSPHEDNSEEINNNIPQSNSPSDKSSKHSHSSRRQLPPPENEEKEEQGEVVDNEKELPARPHVQFPNFHELLQDQMYHNGGGVSHHKRKKKCVARRNEAAGKKKRFVLNNTVVDDNYDDDDDTQQNGNEEETINEEQVRKELEEQINQRIEMNANSQLNPDHNFKQQLLYMTSSSESSDEKNNNVPQSRPTRLTNKSYLTKSGSAPIKHLRFSMRKQMNEDFAIRQYQESRKRNEEAILKKAKNKSKIMNKIHKLDQASPVKNNTNNRLDLLEKQTNPTDALKSINELREKIKAEQELQAKNAKTNKALIKRKKKENQPIEELNAIQENETINNNIQNEPINPVKENQQTNEQLNEKEQLNKIEPSNENEKVVDSKENADSINQNQQQSVNSNMPSPEVISLAYQQYVDQMNQMQKSMNMQMNPNDPNNQIMSFPVFMNYYMMQQFMSHMQQMIPPTPNQMPFFIPPTMPFQPYSQSIPYFNQQIPYFNPQMLNMSQPPNPNMYQQMPNMNQQLFNMNQQNINQVSNQSEINSIQNSENIPSNENENQESSQSDSNVNINKDKSNEHINNDNGENPSVDTTTSIESNEEHKEAINNIQEQPENIETPPYEEQKETLNDDQHQEEEQQNDNEIEQHQEEVPPKQPYISRIKQEKVVFNETPLISSSYHLSGDNFDVTKLPPRPLESALKDPPEFSRYKLEDARCRIYNDDDYDEEEDAMDSELSSRIQKLRESEHLMYKKRFAQFKEQNNNQLAPNSPPHTSNEQNSTNQTGSPQNAGVTRHIVDEDDNLQAYSDSDSLRSPSSERQQNVSQGNDDSGQPRKYLNDDQLSLLSSDSNTEN